MRLFTTILTLVILALCIAVAALFVVQNMEQTVQLGLNLGPLGAWRFASALPAPYVVLGSFLFGVVAVGLLAVLEMVIFQRRIRRLQAMVQGARGSVTEGAL